VDLNQIHPDFCCLVVGLLYNLSLKLRLQQANFVFYTYNNNNNYNNNSAPALVLQQGNAVAFQNTMSTEPVAVEAVNTIL